MDLKHSEKVFEERLAARRKEEKQEFLALNDAQKLRSFVERGQLCGECLHGCDECRPIREAVEAGAAAVERELAAIHYLPKEWAFEEPSKYVENPCRLSLLSYGLASGNDEKSVLLQGAAHLRATALDMELKAGAME